MRKHLQILAILNIVWGSIGILAALIILLVFGGALGIIGVVSHHEPDARIAIPIVGLVGSAIFLLLVITSLPSVAAGFGLLRLAPWARILTIVLSVFHLFSFPFGTALGVYGLWVLLSNETPPLFTRPHGPVRI